MTDKNFTTDVVIGLEIHCELDTITKLFCGCVTKGSDEPNTRTCPTCLGMPGSKPVLNKKVVEFALKLCIALGCEISPELVFSRKSYFYPDMAKNYQISQYEIPLGKKGKLGIQGKEIEITRVHIEEDPASMVHPNGMKDSTYVLVDYNRSGNPLVEIVTEPNMASPDEARDFMKRLITVLGYLGIFDVNHGVIKADANISIKESGYTRVEIKNITGFREIEMALLYEINRQKNEAKIEQETRAWDSERGTTFSIRKKETEEDYGYIIDTDLTPVEIKNEWIEDLKKIMPELAQDKVKKFVENFKIKKEDAEIIAAKKDIARLFEEVARDFNDPIFAAQLFTAKFIRREVMRVLNFNDLELKDTLITSERLKQLLKLIWPTSIITYNKAVEILEIMVHEPVDPEDYVKNKGWKSISDTSELEKFCMDAINENPKAVEDYRKGEAKALNFIVGSVMKKTKGLATPKQVNEILIKLIS